VIDREMVRKLAYACKRCASCRDWSWYDPHLHGFDESVTKIGYTICPTFKHAEGFESDTPRGKVRLAMGIAEGNLEISEGLLRKMYECTCCGNCTEHCPAHRQEKLDPLHLVLEARAFLLERGAKAPSDLGRYLGKAPKALPIPARWIEEPLRRTGAASTLGFFPGCVSPSIVSRLFPGIARSFLSLLASNGIEYQTIDEGWCCGYLQYSGGDHETVVALIEKNLSSLEERNIETLVTTCAGCYFMFSSVYPRLSDAWRRSSISIVHSSQLLARLAAAGALVFSGPGRGPVKVTYHDPCDLGRKGGVFEEPREVLRSLPGVELVEMEQHGENAFCCGAGSDLKVVNPGMALEIAKDRVRQAEATGAEILVSCCPACLWNLSQAAKELGSRLELMDVCELADRGRGGA